MSASLEPSDFTNSPKNDDFFDRFPYDSFTFITFIFLSLLVSYVICKCLLDDHTGDLEVIFCIVAYFFIGLCTKLTILDGILIITIFEILMIFITCVRGCITENTFRQRIWHIVFSMIGFVAGMSAREYLSTAKLS